MSFSVGQRILIVLSLIMLLWYVAGSQYNRRQSIRALNWLREGLALLGGEVQAAWIGSATTGAKVAVQKPAPPFRQLEVTFLLESREWLPLWLLNLVRGRRDDLTIKAELRSSGQGEIQVVPAGSRLERSLREDGQPVWDWRVGPHSLRIAYRGKQAEALSTALMPFLQDYGFFVRHLAWRREKPHFILHLRLAGLTGCSPVDFFNDLRTAFVHSRQTAEDE